LQENSEIMRQEMLEKPMARLLFEKSYPTVIIQLITIIYNTADTYFVSKINTQSSAAVGVVFSLMSIIQAVGFGIGVGASSLIARSLGAKDNKRANTVGSTAVFMGGIFGIGLMIWGLINVNWLMRKIGSSESVLPYAIGYGRFILYASPFMCLSFVLNNILKSEGKPIFAMFGMAGGAVMNFILDPIFIFGFGMGINGAALATMISQITSTTIMFSYFLSKKGIVHLSFQNISREPICYLNILSTGIPTILRQGLGSVSTTILNVQAAFYGDSAVSAISIANKIYMVVRNVILGIGQGYQPIAGYCYGAGKKDRVKKAFYLSCVAGTFLCLLSTIVIYWFRVPIMAWFRSDKEVVHIGSYMLTWFCLSMPFLAYSTYVNQTYQCLGFRVAASVLASLRQGIFFIPLAMILPRKFGLPGLEMLQSVSDILTFCVSIPFQIWFFRKHLQEK